MSTAGSLELRTRDEQERDRQEPSPDVRVVEPRATSLVPDKGKIVLIILVIHGVGTLMPWNMFITAASYFKDYKLGNTSATYTDEIAVLQNNFLYYLGLAAQVPNFLFTGLNLLINFKSGNLRLRVNVTLAIEATVFIITIALAAIDTDGWRVGFFYATMLCVAVLNTANGIYQNCIFGTAAKFDPFYNNGVLIGSNLSGVFTSLVNICTICFAPETKIAAILYFCTALLIIVICLITYNYLPHNAHFKHCEQVAKTASGLRPKVQDDSSLTISAQPTIQSTSQSSDVPESVKTTVASMTPAVADDIPEVQVPSIGSGFVHELKRKWFIFMKCWRPCLGVYLVFFVTLSLFPAVVAEVKQVQGWTRTAEFFTACFCFLNFNFWALIGNLVVFKQTILSRERVWWFILARFAFVPFFLFCNITSKGRVWPILINDNTSYAIAIALFAFSSGFLSTCCMIHISSYLRPEEASTGGMLGGFFIIFGIFSGVNFSIVLLKILQYSLFT